MTVAIPKGLKPFRKFLTFLVFSILICCKTANYSNGITNEREIVDQSDYNQSKQIYLADLNEVETFIKLNIEGYTKPLDYGEPFFPKLWYLNATRRHFQRVGFLMEYVDADLYNLFNGAPVFKEDHSMPSNQVIAPHGFQVIEEMKTEYDDFYANDSLVVEEYKFMLRQLDYYKTVVEKLDFNEQLLINAFYYQLIRLETLSLINFDMVDRANGSEFKQVIITMHQHLGKLLPNKYLRQIDDITENFDDKLAVVAYIQKYKAILVPLFHPNDIPSPINYTAANIYDADFLNASYYGDYGMGKKANGTKIELGKKLFNDVNLSTSKKFSCATCHQPDKYFTDGLQLSNSNSPDLSLKRNTPTLIHAAYQSKYMYDGRSKSLEDQMLHVFNNRMEFQTEMSDIVAYLKSEASDEMYRELFVEAFPRVYGENITLQTITDALATYMRSLTGHNSNFDQYMRGEKAFISEEVKQGFNLFMGKAKCGTCHFAPTFSGLLPPFYKESELENIGVPIINSDSIWEIDRDEGRFNFYPNEAFKHFFKTPTIRNVAQTSPYMHNGVFKTLEEVMDFYNKGGGAGHGLDYPNQTLASNTLGLTPIEIEAIIAFMEALTDSSYLEY